MKIKALFLISMLASQELKPIDPITGMIVAGGMVIAGLRTATGKVLAGFCLGKASATPAGKYLIARAQMYGKNAIQKRMQTRRELVFANVHARLVAVAPGFFGALQRTKTQTTETVQTVTQKVSGSYENSGMSDLLKKFKEQVAAEKVKIQSSSPAAQGQAVPGGKIHAEFTQNNIRQETTVSQGPFSTFIHNDPRLTAEYADAVSGVAAAKANGKKQFWKGAFFGGAAGATTMAWLDKKREEERMNALLYGQN